MNQSIFFPGLRAKQSINTWKSPKYLIFSPNLTLPQEFNYSPYFVLLNKRDYVSYELFRLWELKWSKVGIFYFKKMPSITHSEKFYFGYSTMNNKESNKLYNVLYKTPIKRPELSKQFQTQLHSERNIQPCWTRLKVNCCKFNPVMNFFESTRSLMKFHIILNCREKILLFIFRIHICSLLLNYIVANIICLGHALNSKLALGITMSDNQLYWKWTWVLH